MKTVRKIILRIKQVNNFFVFLVVILPLLFFFWTGKGIKQIISGKSFAEKASACWDTFETSECPSDCPSDCGGCITGDNTDCADCDCACSDCDCGCDC